MKKYALLALASLAVIAAIIIPLALISGAVVATSNYSEYQITSIPIAKVSTSELTANNVRVSFTIDRSNMVINSNNNTSGTDTKYEYVHNYLIYLIDMVPYDKEVERIRNEGTNEAVNITDYKDREIEILGEDIYIDGEKTESTVTLNTEEVYLLTADSVVQADKTYYEKSGNGYEVASLKPSRSIEKGLYYEKAESTTFSFTINKLYSKHKYAVGVQFYYSVNDKTSTLYNKNLQDKKEFITK